MATEFRAVNRIRHGVSNDKGEQTGIKEFEPSERVTGLSKADMKALWDAGALEQVEVADPAPSPEPDPEGASTDKVDSTE